MWDGSTQDYAGQIDFGADRPAFVEIPLSKFHFYEV